MPASAGSYLTMRMISRSIQPISKPLSPSLKPKPLSSSLSSLHLHSTSPSSFNLNPQPRHGSSLLAPSSNAAVSTRFYSSETQGYRFNHTMLRVKDPKASLHFYCDILGMDLIDEHDAGDFKLFFLAYQHQKDVERSQREGILELTWNKGTETKEGQVYHNGNKQPQGFGHTCISVPDIHACCDRLEKLGVKFQKKLTDGKMKNIAFALDPDEYWCEIIEIKK